MKNDPILDSPDVKLYCNRTKKGPHNFWTKCPEFGHSAYDVLTYVHLNIL